MQGSPEALKMSYSEQLRSEKASSTKRNRSKDNFCPCKNVSRNVVNQGILLRGIWNCLADMTAISNCLKAGARMNGWRLTWQMKITVAMTSVVNSRILAKNSVKKNANDVG